MSGELKRWIGRVVEIRFRERTKPMLVRIDRVEITPICCRSCPQTYFIGRYA